MFNNEIFFEASKNPWKEGFRIVLLKRKLSVSILFLKGVLFASGTNSGISLEAVYINEKSFIDFDGIWIMLH